LVTASSSSTSTAFPLPLHGDPPPISISFSVCPCSTSLATGLSLPIFSLFYLSPVPPLPSIKLGATARRRRGHVLELFGFLMRSNGNILELTKNTKSALVSPVSRNLDCRRSV
jgi:hypothetical protein